MDKEINDKISRCKALQGQTVLDIINSDKFRDNLAGYWTAQKEDRKAIKSSYAAMYKVGGTKGYKLPAHPIDKLFDCDVEQMRDEYTKVVAKVSALPAAQRAYIWQLGQQAYALTVAQIVCEEFPELRDKLIPKSKAKQIKMNDTVIQAEKRRNAIGRIIGALKGGRHLSLKDGREFEVSQMHTCFCKIQQKIFDGKIPGYIMKSRWITDANGIRYKEYWFEDEQN